jgi:RNA polymerase sigma-70 factor (ECF subfamily)
MGPELLAQLLDEHSAALVLYARQWCAVPEDVVQEAFVKLAAQRKTDRPVAWLYRVVRNSAISAGRSERRRQRHETSAARPASWFAPETSGLDVEAVTEALATLSLEQREVIVAHLWGGRTFEQIAELLDTSASSAHRVYVAGLTVLRERLGVPCPTKSRPMS